MTRTEIKAALEELQAEPTRSLGQNFLHDQNLAGWIVRQLDLQPGEAWVEVGPGLGALTEYAQQCSGNGCLLEKDDRLIDYLRRKFAALEVIHGDATQVDLRRFYPRGPLKVLGNLPYYLSSQMLFHFLAEPSPVVAAVFTLQKELAERLSAKPSTKEYGALTVLIGRRWKVKYLRTMPPAVFLPVPGVESAVVLLTPRPGAEQAPVDALRFEKLVKQGFSQRRKQMRKMLADEVADWTGFCACLGVPETVRAEELSIAQWVQAARFGVVQTAAQDLTGELFDVVDAEDQPVRVAPRGEVHREGWMHRAVHIFVFNTAGELFLQKRSRWKDMHPSRWDSSAAGHVNAGQEYAETAAREVEEELGVVAPVEEIGYITARPNTGWEFVRLYRATHEGPFHLAPSEIESGSWFTHQQVGAWTRARPEDFATGFLECWQMYLTCNPQRSGKRAR